MASVFTDAGVEPPAAYAAAVRVLRDNLLYREPYKVRLVPRKCLHMAQ
jgi:hypothetical protein